MANLGRVEVEVAIDVKHNIALGTTPDGLPELWLLYRQEPWRPDGIEEREMHLWVRRCDVFSSRERAIAHLDALIGDTVRWQRYADVTGGWFPELWIGRLNHSRWWLTSAPLDPFPGASK
jgi:hypothetical protein